MQIAQFGASNFIDNHLAPDAAGPVRSRVSLRERYVALALFGALLALRTVSASASNFCGPIVCDPLPPAIGTIALSNLDPPVSVTAPGNSLSGPNSLGTVSYGRLTPFVLAESRVGTQISAGLPSNITTSYFHYEVGGASVLPLPGDVFLPVIVQGSYVLAAHASNAFGAGDAAVLIKVNYSDFMPNQFTASIASGDCGPTHDCDSSGVFTLKGQIRIGVPMSIDMYAIAHSQSFVSNIGEAGSFAFIDPLISIDPAFADAAKFTLYVSPAVANTTAVPLPATGPLFAMAAVSLLKGRKRMRKGKPHSCQ